MKTKNDKIKVDKENYLKNFIPLELQEISAFVNFTFINRKNQPLYQILEIFLKKDFVIVYPDLDYFWNEAIEIKQLEEQILVQAFCESYKANFNKEFSNLNSSQLREIKIEIGKNKIIELIKEEKNNLKYAEKSYSDAIILKADPIYYGALKIESSTDILE